MCTKKERKQIFTRSFTPTNLFKLTTKYAFSYFTWQTFNTDNESFFSIVIILFLFLSIALCCTLISTFWHHENFETQLISMDFLFCFVLDLVFTYCAISFNYIFMLFSFGFVQRHTTFEQTRG